MTITVNYPFKALSFPATTKKFIRVSDGDTPVIEQPIRMVSCDTPEKAQYAGKPTVSQPKLDKCKTRLEDGFYDDIPIELRDYLKAKLTDDAAERHINAGYRASEEFDKTLIDHLTRDDGTVRNLGTILVQPISDRYGRLLAYIVPWFSKGELEELPKGNPKRKTMNLAMIETGWAAFFPIYPSLPKLDDMNLAITAAESAWEHKLGIWKEFGNDVLLAYEFRMCIKLGTAKDSQDGIKNAFQRICVDIRNMKEVGLFGFYDVPPCYRLWVWEEDIVKARGALGIIQP